MERKQKMNPALGRIVSLDCRRDWQRISTRLWKALRKEGMGKGRRRSPPLLPSGCQDWTRCTQKESVHGDFQRCRLLIRRTAPSRWLSVELFACTEGWGGPTTSKSACCLAAKLALADERGEQLRGPSSRTTALWEACRWLVPPSCAVLACTHWSTQHAGHCNCHLAICCKEHFTGRCLDEVVHVFVSLTTNCWIDLKFRSFAGSFKKKKIVPVHCSIFWDRCSHANHCQSSVSQF